MSTITKTILGLILLVLLGVACTAEQAESPKVAKGIQHPINPNGDSELALLMRAMYDEARIMKKQLANGEPITMTLDHEAILTAHATEPDKAASETFKSFASAYLQAVEELKIAPPERRVNIYDQMVSTCMGCHQMLCPGPMARIRHLQ
ncbi:MAG: hypothetical protein AAFP77_28920 [Bacteroidota bacterium]